MFVAKKKVGILGGGQLGQMMIQAVIGYDLEIFVLDPDGNAPCRAICANFKQGDFLDFDTVVEFGRELDVVTIEFENVNVEALYELQRLGVEVFPQPEVVELIQNKGAQKRFYEENGIATAKFEILEEAEDVLEVEDRFLPGVLKVCRGGYDGKGVMKVSGREEVMAGWKGASILEEKVKIRQELGVIVARNVHGEVRSFPPVEMKFNEKANLVEFLYTPARVEGDVQAEAMELALKVASELEIVGVLAVEMFVTEAGEVLVNEIAPRPHNSGHSSIECNKISQFEQHFRAILGLPLGETGVKQAGVMVNLLGEEGFEGEAKYVGVEEVLREEGVHLHLYGKLLTKPFRKMGHLNVTADSLEEAIEKTNKIKNLIKIVS